MIRRTLSALLAALAITAFAASAAFAGEITGNGKPVPAPHVAQSECSFSGHNDDPDAPLSGTDNPGGQSQSYGQLNRLGILENLFGVTPKDFNPGDACRGNLGAP
jgi:hypothetical protein